MKIKTTGKYTILNKPVFSLNLEKNNLPSKRSQINEALKGKKVEIGGFFYEVIGIEMYCTPETYDHKDIAIMVKPIENEVSSNNNSNQSEPSGIQKV